METFDSTARTPPLSPRPLRLRLGATLLLWCLVSACAPPDLMQQLPHELSALQLEGTDDDGRATWVLNTTAARYDRARRSAVLTRPEAVLYRDGAETYRLRARRGLVLGDGKFIQLQADVQLVQPGDASGPATVIRGDLLRWDTAAETVTLGRNPVAQRGRLQLSAREVELLINADDLAFREQVRLVQQPGPRVAGEQRPGEALRLEATEARWNLRSGAFTAAGPIRGEQGVAGEPPSRRLSSAALAGNSRAGWLDFLGQVRFAAPADDLLLTGERVRWWQDREVLRSTDTVQGRFGAVQLSGEDVEVDMGNQEATLGDRCRLAQPDTTLQADRCQWQWDERTVLAEGNVVVERDPLGLVTRADTLSGTVGDDGLLRFASPGQQVSTDLLLDQPPWDPAAPNRRAGPLPIVLQDAAPSLESSPGRRD